MFFYSYAIKLVDGLEIKLRRSLVILKKGLARETEETKEMLRIYARFSKGKASREEMNMANAQFRDIIKGLGLGIFAVLPFAPITIPFIVKLGKLVGVDILPSGFSEDLED